MKTAVRENPTSVGHHAHEPSTWCGRSKQSCSFTGGWKVSKISAAGGFFLLTFPFIERFRTCFESAVAAQERPMRLHNLPIEKRSNKKPARGSILRIAILTRTDC